MQPPAYLRSMGPRYVALWVGQSIGQLGTSIAVFTIPLLIFYIQEATGTDSTLDFSITYALETAPVFLVGIVGGVLLDRWRLRSVMVAANLLRACAFFYLSADFGNFGMGTVFAFAFIVGSLATLFEGAMYSSIPSLVKHNRLADANALINVSIQLNDTIGPLIAGFLAATFATPAVGLFMSGVLFAASAVSMRWVGDIPPHRRPDEQKRPFFEETANGIRYLWAEPRLRITTISAAVANFVTGFLEATFLVLFFVVLAAPGEREVGFLLSSWGVGGIVGALMAPMVVRRLGFGRTMTMGMVVGGAGLLAFMFTTYGLIALALGVTWMIGLSAINVALASIRQHYASESMLGRVITAARAIGWATLPVGALLGGWLGSTQSTYPWVARTFPLILLANALWLFTTVIWSDTHGPRDDDAPTELPTEDLGAVVTEEE